MKAYRAYHFDVTPVENSNLFSAWLSSFPFESFEITQIGVTAYIPFDKDNLIDEIACLNVPFKNIYAKLKIEDIKGKNWNRIWESQFKPIVVKDFTLRASFHQPAKTKNEIIIDPQMSFGTGHHATTQLMLEQIFELQFLGKSVLDVGTGTGVLAIAAKKRKAINVTAIDIEDWCVVNAIENSLKNNIFDINYSTKDIEDFQSLQVDVILANINKNVLKLHISTYAKLLRPSGILLLSGFHKEDIQPLMQIADNHGLTYVHKTSRQSWICLKFIN